MEAAVKQKALMEMSSVLLSRLAATGSERDGDRDLGKALGKDLGKEHPRTGQTGWVLIGSCSGESKRVKFGMIVTFLFVW